MSIQIPFAFEICPENGCTNPSPGYCRGIVRRCKDCKKRRESSREIELRLNRRKAGLCVRCGKKAVPGKSICAEHKKREDDLYAERKAKRMSVREAKLKKSFCIEEGCTNQPLCFYGGKPSRCKSCRDNRRKYLREMRKKAGLCECGANSVPGKRVCEMCANKRKLNRQNRKRSGLCECGNPLISGKALCVKCGNKNRERACRRHKELIDNLLCSSNNKILSAKGIEYFDESRRDELEIDHVISKSRLIHIGCPSALTRKTIANIKNLHTLYGSLNRARNKKMLSAWLTERNWNEDAVKYAIHLEEIAIMWLREVWRPNLTWDDIYSPD